MIKLLIPAAIAVAVSSAAKAESPSQHETVHIVVQQRDLNLNTTEGRAQLQRRIQLAVRQICGPSGTRDLDRANAERHCRAAIRKS